MGIELTNIKNDYGKLCYLAAICRNKWRERYGDSVAFDKDKIIRLLNDALLNGIDDKKLVFIVKTATYWSDLRARLELEIRNRK
jgi:hypothetical protein